MRSCATSYASPCYFEMDHQCREISALVPSIWNPSFTDSRSEPLPQFDVVAIRIADFPSHIGVPNFWPPLAHRNYHPMYELYQTWLGAIHARDKALELTNRLRSRKDAGLSASNVARIAEPELANQGNFNLRSSDHAQEGGFALIHRASATAVAAR